MNARPVSAVLTSVIVSALLAACGNSESGAGGTPVTSAATGTGSSTTGSSSQTSTGAGGASSTTGSDSTTTTGAGGGDATGSATSGSGGGTAAGTSGSAGATGAGGTTVGAGGSSGGAGGAGTGGAGPGGSGGGGGAGGGNGSCTGKGVPVPAAERVSNGNPVLPPKWAFGILWGSYYDQVGSTSAQGGNLLTAAMRVRSEYSGDLMWIDSSWLWHDYTNDATIGSYYVCFKFDPMSFPDPGTMIATLRDNHFHFGVWQWPWMGHGCQYFDEGTSKKYFVMNGNNPAQVTGGWHGDPNPAAFDFTNPATVTWWTGLNKPLTDWGLDFMKLDTTQSQQLTPTTSGGGKLFDAKKDYVHERNLAAYDLTKLYAAANNPDAKLNGARGFVMPKAASPANDQMPGWWTDDTTASFDGMKTEMGRAAQLDTATTSAYWCGDTGGYNQTPSDELYVRWLEYTSFTPLQEYFAAKTTGLGARFPWLFGAQAQTIHKQYADLRYRLLPFRYSNAMSAYAVKPVVYPVKWVGTTQLLVPGSGASQLLVQPVTTAGDTTASVALPAGSNWIHYWTGKSYPGGMTANVPAPLDQVPLFVKAGSIIPMGPSQRWVDEKPADPLTLDIYPAGSTSYTLYEDDGVSEAYLGGAYAMTKFTSDDTGGKVVVTIGAQTTAKYAFSGQICARGYVLKINGQAGAPASVTRDGTAVPTSSAGAFAAATEGWYYDSAAKVVWVKFPLASSASTKVSL